MRSGITQSGITLVELMIAMAISLTLMLGVGAIYSNSKHSSLVQHEYASLQENARFAMHFLETDIRKSGFVGCAWNNNANYDNYLDTSNADYDDSLSNFAVGLEGREAISTGPNNTVDLKTYSSAWNDTLPVSVPGTAHKGSDVIIVRYADGDGIKLTENKESGNFWIDDKGSSTITSTTENGVTRNCHPATGVCEGDILMVSDCEKSRMFQVTNGMSYTAGRGIKLVHANSAVPDPPGNANASWGGNSDKVNDFEPGDSEILKAKAFAYYIDDSAAPAVDGVTEPALWRVELVPGAVPEELVQGVENMQVLFGIDTDKTAADQTGDGIANRYVPYNGVTVATDNVVSARISMLVRSAKQVPHSGNDPVEKQFILSGMTAASGTKVVTAVDERLRQVYTTTIKLRNKGVQ